MPIRIFLLLLSFLFGCRNEEPHSISDIPLIQNGTVNLKHSGYANGEIYKLKGQWFFKWGEFIEPAPLADLETQFDNFIDIPAPWDSQSSSAVDGGSYPGTGYGTYMLRVEGLSRIDNQILSIYGIPGAARLFILNSDGKVLAEAFQGRPSVEATREIPIVYKESGAELPAIQSKIPINDTLVILLQVSVHHYPRGGVWEAPELSTGSTWSNSMKFELFTMQILLGALVIVGFYHLILFGLRVSETSNLFFGLFTLSVALRPLSMGVVQRSFAVGDSVAGFISLMRIELLSVPLICISFGLFLNSIVGTDGFKSLLKYLIVWPGAFLAALTLGTVPTTFVDYLFLYQVYSFVFLLLAFVHLIRRFRSGDKLAGLCLGALTFMSIGAMNDILHVLLIIESAFVGPYTAIGFILLQAGILAARSAKMHKRVQQLSSHLQEEVAVQTVELQEKTAAAIIAREESEQLKQRALTDARKLRELDRQKTTFFQNISHELRTPLTLMIHPLDAAINEIGQNENIVVARRNCMRLMRLVNQLLDFQKLSTRKVELKLQTINAVSLLRLVADHFKSSSSHREIQFQATINGEPISENMPEIPILAELDALEKIVFNYLSNALKFTTPGGEIELGLQEFEGYVRLYVSDTGPGISEEDQSRIFQVFTQLDESSTRAHEGSGLGLALCKTLAEELNAKVGLETSLGRGATFWVDLLRGDGKCTIIDHEFVPKSWLLEEPSESPEMSRELPVAEKGKRILVCDDLGDMRYMIEQIITKAGFEVFTAKDGIAAIELMDERIPDLVITDWMMPRLDGLGLVQAIRENTRLAGLPVIMLTAKSDESSRLVGLDSGADAFLGKPFNELELLSLIRNLLHLKSNEHDLKANLLQLEDALAALKLAELEKVEAARQSTLSRLASGLAHELRNPLNIIQGIAETIDEDPKQGLSDVTARLLGQASARADGVVQRLVKLTDVTVTTGNTRLMNAINRMSDITYDALANVDGSLRVEGEAEITVAMGDAELSQVLVLLVENAIEACDGRPDIVLRVFSESTEAKVEVIDHGQGIEVADEEKLFEPFYTTRLERNASGLGLTVARRFLRLRGGNLGVKSRVNPTCFEIKLTKLNEE